MNITVNGEAQRIEPATSVADLLARLEIDMRGAAVERNMEIVPKSLYARTPLAEGDRLEIIGFIGGG